MGGPVGGSEGVLPKNTGKEPENLGANRGVKHLFYSTSAWPLCFSASTICLFPPLESLHLCPCPLSITLLIPLAPALEEERAGPPPPQEGRWGRAAPAGREGKRREGRKWPTEEGGIRWEGAALFELLSSSALQSQAQGHPRTKVLLPSPRTHAGTACLRLEGRQVLVGMFKGGAQSSMCAADSKHLLH